MHVPPVIRELSQSISVLPLYSIFRFRDPSSMTVHLATPISVSRQWSSSLDWHLGQRSSTVLVLTFIVFLLAGGGWGCGGESAYAGQI